MYEGVKKEFLVNWLLEETFDDSVVVCIIMEMQAFAKERCEQCYEMESDDESFHERCAGYVFLDQLNRHDVFVTDHEKCDHCRERYDGEDLNPCFDDNDYDE